MPAHGNSALPNSLLLRRRSALDCSQAHSRAHATRPVGGQPGAYSCCVLRCRLIHAHQLDRRRSSKRRRVAGCVLATLLLSEKRPRLMLQSLAATSGLLATGALTEPLLGHVAEDVAHARRVELDRRMTQLLGGAIDLLVGLQLRIELQASLACLLKAQGVSLAPRLRQCRPAICNSSRFTRISVTHGPTRSQGR